MNISHSQLDIFVQVVLDMFRQLLVFLQVLLIFSDNFVRVKYTGQRRLRSDANNGVLVEEFVHPWDL